MSCSTLYAGSSNEDEDVNGVYIDENTRLLIDHFPPDYTDTTFQEAMELPTYQQVLDEYGFPDRESKDYISFIFFIMVLGACFVTLLPLFLDDEASP